MMSERKPASECQPQGEEIRNAVKWVSDERKFNSERNIKAVLEESLRKIRLSPKDAEFLRRFVMEEETIVTQGGSLAKPCLLWLFCGIKNNVRSRFHAGTR